MGYAKFFHSVYALNIVAYLKLSFRHNIKTNGWGKVSTELEYGKASLTTRIVVLEEVQAGALESLEPDAEPRCCRATGRRNSISIARSHLDDAKVLLNLRYGSICGRPAMPSTLEQ